MIALTVMCIFIAMSAPSFRRSMEHSRADIAGANLGRGLRHHVCVNKRVVVRGSKPDVRTVCRRIGPGA